MSDPIAALPPLRDMIAAHGLAADKRFGQHFLLDLNLTGKIARYAGDLSEGTVIEVGPGPGGLTRALLLAGGKHVVAIEMDRRMVAGLAPVVEAAGGRLQVIEGDALEVDPRTLGPAPYRIVANLPYNVGTPLLIGWLRVIDSYQSLTLMFQKEVADRICAKVNDDAYGRLAVIAQYQADCESLFDLPPQAFTPPPKVWSSVVQLTPRANREPCGSLSMLERVTAAAFGQRRKMLRSSLKSLGRDPIPFLEQAGLLPTARAEEIDVAGFARLSALYAAA
ncbi:16S rRNA (adenine(1518)-N(6)/adenine(1519)-N(6))-dimethyltransferase RsmA [Lacibacterium aquatile]|uniref:Ribosomal RNA small subunit methyltransferase A n=1 Tax=Lacibacterium aquatile TaxID=1168082 RepID=A0ABW5DLE1_9PROT